VLELEPDQIEPAPKIGTRLKTEFIKGMGKRDEQFIMILDINKVFSIEAINSKCPAGIFSICPCRAYNTAFLTIS
jgi:purine-binding chemotaxis protein CheW